MILVAFNNFVMYCIIYIKVNKSYYYNRYCKLIINFNFSFEFHSFYLFGPIVQ